MCRKLEALLIVPIQRVPRYRLLLTELISHTDEEDSEHTILNAALNQVEMVARHINEQIRDQENMQRMIRIQKSLFLVFHQVLRDLNISQDMWVHQLHLCR